MADLKVPLVLMKPVEFCGSMMSICLDKDGYWSLTLVMIADIDGRRYEHNQSWGIADPIGNDEKSVAYQAAYERQEEMMRDLNLLGSRERYWIEIPREYLIDKKSSKGNIQAAWALSTEGIDPDPPTE